MDSTSGSIYNIPFIFPILTRILREGTVKQSDLDDITHYRKQRECIDRCIEAGILTMSHSTSGKLVRLYSLTPLGVFVARSMLIANSAVSGNFEFEGSGMSAELDRAFEENPNLG